MLLKDSLETGCCGSGGSACSAVLTGSTLQKRALAWGRAARARVGNVFGGDGTTGALFSTKKLQRAVKKAVHTVTAPQRKLESAVRGAAKRLEKNVLRPVGAIAGQVTQVAIQKASELDANKTFSALAGAGVFTPQSVLDNQLSIERTRSGEFMAPAPIDPAAQGGGGGGFLDALLGAGKKAVGLDEPESGESGGGLSTGAMVGIGVAVLGVAAVVVMGGKK